MAMIRAFAASVVLLTMLLGCAQQTSQPLGQSKLFALQQYLITNRRSPVDYVVNKFADHDVIFLGEAHRIKDNPVLVQQLIPGLYRAGVYVLALEFANEDDQPLIDSLLRADSFDEHLARHIQMNQYSLWPWREYLDIYKTAWQLNASLPDTARPFRILGVNCDLDWSPVQNRGDMDNPELRRQVWAGCSEENWAGVVLRAVAEGDKVLAYCGMHHAFTKYRQPIVSDEGKFVRFGDVRFGNHVFQAIGDRCMTVAMHHAWGDRLSGYARADRRPVNGAIDQVMASLGDDFQSCGFDVTGNPFGDLPDSETIYAVGYDDFSLSDFCDGYIYFRPFAEYETVTYIEGFYTEDNIELARIKAPQVQYRQASPERFEEDMKKQIEREREQLRAL